MKLQETAQDREATDRGMKLQGTAQDREATDRE